MQDLMDMILNKSDYILRLAKSRNDERILLFYDEVIQSIKHIQRDEASGPDQVNAKVLWSSTDQLTKLLIVLFQASLDLYTVLRIWKMSEIVPIPKIRCPKTKNDLRPIALTSLL